ncbi:hypothetical protein SS50377_25241 [Spironucleus salmonicida]|uniref:Uncharacterized protein n=1 Tax=Spironucleus salmonicida TaxID=348837 RepID=V6LCB7_9EUKA|nr:hypothetical protein SS50377_25241 [Spironucleus salmonicida]|eukprot:EST41878.1 Hypothetical protein SS50377_18714 [Spironucleus salmonicida]
MQNAEFRHQVEAQWAVLQAELVELVRDIKYNERCIGKYGESAATFVAVLQTLKDQKLKRLIKLRDAAMKVNITLEQVEVLTKELFQE